MKVLRYVCNVCGSENIMWDAWAQWNINLQEMELLATYDYAWCDDCQGECTPKEIDEDEK